MNNQLSVDMLKIRELEAFLNSELYENSYGFTVKSGNKLSYKKVLPKNEKYCEVKLRELYVTNNVLRLRYDSRNVTNLLNNVKDFKIYNNNGVINIEIKFNDYEILKSISQKSYDI